MPGDPRPIGVFDSGMGGLTVLRAMEARLPAETFFYLGDTARLPYGTKSAETVAAYALQATRLLIQEGVKMVVVACNTASAVALEALARELAPVPVIGVIEPGARAGVAATRNNRIAVIATEGTVKGGAYARAIAALDGAIQVVQQPCQVFVALAEEGWTTPRSRSPRRDAISARSSRGRRPPTRSCSAAPISPCWREPSGKSSAMSVALVDSAATTAAAVAEALAARGLAAPARVARALLRHGFARAFRAGGGNLPGPADLRGRGRACGPPPILS